MEAELIKAIPPGLVNFILVTVFSLLIGLEQRRHHIDEKYETLFGTDRTFTLIGILGYILYSIDPQGLVPFLGGGAVVAALLSIYYYQKIVIQKMFGFTSLLIALITYCLAPLVYTQPVWLVLTIVVCILIVTEIKESLFKLSQKFDNDEFITLAKFIIMAGIILPVLPDTPISSHINITPFHFWLAIVVVSTISYLSYLLRKFVFPDAGILLTGMLGGMYSSTATTVILARESKGQPAGNKIVSAIMIATTMMYLRILLLAFFFDAKIALSLLPYFAVLAAVSCGLCYAFIKMKTSVPTLKNEENINTTKTNPLEFKTAFLFGGLFIFFAIVTTYVLKNFGGAGINIMSLIVGVTDIDPFIINLFQGKYNITSAVITMAILNATASNNLLKLIYALVLSDKSLRRELVIGFGTLIILGFAFGFVVMEMG